MTETFVYGGQEVVLTGRVATRTTARKEHKLHEIKPADVEEEDPKFCKWVKFEELYEIQENINNNEEE